MDRDQLGAYVALLAAQLLFATLPVAGKVGLEQVHYLVFALVRMSGAALVLVAVVHGVLGHARPSLRDLGSISVYAVFGIVINQVIFLWGLSLTTATNAALIITTIPVFTYAIAVVARRERLDARRGLGILVALFGVVVLLDPRGFSMADGTLLGNALILVNALSYALYLVISRPLLRRVRPMVMTTWLFVAGTLITLPVVFLIVGPPLPGATPWQLSAVAWLILAYVIVGPTVGTYTLNLVALSRVASSTVAAFIYVQPVAAVFLAWLLLGEPVLARHFLAGALVLGGVTLVSVLRSPRAAPGP